MFWDIETVQEVVCNGGDILDQGVPGWGETIDGFLGNKTVHHVEAQISIDDFKAEKSKHLGHSILILGALDHVELLDAVFEGLSFTVNHSKALHDV